MAPLVPWAADRAGWSAVVGRTEWITTPMSGRCRGMSVGGGGLGCHPGPADPGEGGATGHTSGGPRLAEAVEGPEAGPRGGVGGVVPGRERGVGI